LIVPFVSFIITTLCGHLCHHPFQFLPYYQIIEPAIDLEFAADTHYYDSIGGSLYDSLSFLPFFKIVQHF
jgi:hypothetical protein